MSEFGNCYFSDECSVLDAATKGAMTAIQLVLGIIANIIAFISFIAFLNGVLSWLGMLVGAEGLTSEVRNSYILILFLIYKYVLF
jgi:pyrimidine nucleoside transport protein